MPRAALAAALCGQSAMRCSSTMTSRRDDNYISTSSSAPLVNVDARSDEWAEVTLETTDAQVGKLMGSLVGTAKCAVTLVYSADKPVTIVVLISPSAV